MKRKILITLFIFTSLFLYSSSFMLQDRLLATPFYNMAFFGTYEDVFVNPASFPFRSDKTLNFYSSIGVRENYSKEPFLKGEKFPFAQNLNTDVLLSFAGSNIVLSAQLEEKVLNRSYEADTLTFDFKASYHVQVDISYKLWDFALGLRLQGGNENERIQKTINSVTDIGANMLFERFFPISGSEYFNIGLSGFYNYGGFGATLFIKDLLSVNGEGKTVSNWNQIINSSAFGLSYWTNQYTQAGNLRGLRLRLGATFTPFTTTSAKLNASMNLIFQLLPSSSIWLGVNFISYQDYDTLFFDFDLTKNASALALRLEFNSFDLTLNTSVPLSIFREWNTEMIEFETAFNLYF